MKNLKSRTVAITLILITAAFMIGYALSSDAAKPKIIQLPFGRIARMLYKIEAKLDAAVEPSSGEVGDKLDKIEAKLDDVEPGEATDLTEVNGKLDAIEAKLDDGPGEVTVDLSEIEERLTSIEQTLLGIQELLENMPSGGEPELDY